MKDKEIFFLDEEYTNNKEFMYVYNIINEDLYYVTDEKDEPYTTYNTIPIKSQNLKETLLKISKNNLPPILKFKIHDFLWVYYREFESSLKAFNGFCDIILNESETKDHSSLFYRCLSIYLTTKNKENDKQMKKLFIFQIEDNKINENYIHLNLLKKSYEYKFFTNVEIIQLLENQIELLEKGTNYSLILDYLDYNKKLLNKKIPIDAEKISNIIRKKADIHIKYANNENNNLFNRVHELKLAINELKNIENTVEERCLLQQKLLELEKKSFKGMHKFEITINISETVEEYSRILGKLTLEERFYYFILFCQLLKFDELVNQVKLKEQGSLSHIWFNNIRFDKNGRQIAIFPNFNDALNEVKPNLMLAYTDRYCVQLSSFLVQHIIYITSIHNFTDYVFENELKKIVESSCFIPIKRKESFIKGLMLGFKGDFSSSMHILAPQIENAVRVLAMECGDSIVKIDVNKTEEFLSLDSLLKGSKLNECVDEKVIYYIRMAFVSPFGFNMRNDISHSLLNDDDFNNTKSYYIWWLVLRICLEFSSLKYEFESKINKKIK